MCYNLSMSKKEKIKFILDFAKALTFALLTALFGIFAFIVVNIEKLNNFQMIASAFGIIVIVIFFYFLIRYMVKKLKDLEALE